MIYRYKFTSTVLATVGFLLILEAGNRTLNAISSFDLHNFNKSIFPEHNSYRLRHHSPELGYSKSLQGTAQAHAEELLSTGKFMHSSASQRNGAGENLYYTFSQYPLEPASLASQAVEAWYEESENYDYNDHSFSAKAGHFTQVVWKSTTLLGCGFAQGPKTISGRTGTINYVVCHYAPAGNNGDYSSNVLKP